MTLQETTPNLTGRIRRDLYAIIDHYDETLEPQQRGSIKLPTQAPKGTPIRYAPKALKEAPAPVSLHVLDARREAHRDLHFWARFVMGEVRDINGNNIRAHIDGTNTAALATFVAHWADRITDDHPEDAENLANEAEKHARTLRALAQPARRDWIPIGQCPTPAEDGPCGGQVRAYTETGHATCAQCGTDDTINGWVTRIVGTVELVTIPQLADILRRRWGTGITERTLRNWRKEGRFTAAQLGPVPLFDPHQVFRELAHYELMRSVSILDGR